MVNLTLTSLSLFDNRIACTSCQNHAESASEALTMFCMLVDLASPSVIRLGQLSDRLHVPQHHNSRPAHASRIYLHI